MTKLQRFILGLGVLFLFGSLYAYATDNFRIAIFGGQSIVIRSTDNGDGTQSPHVVVDSASAVGVTDDQGPDASGTFTNATQTTSVTSIDIDGYGTVTVSINGTYGTASGQFEQSDDGATTWYPVLCSQEGAGILETGYSQLTTTNRMWRCGISGADHFRIRSTAVASGTINVLASFSGMPTTNGATVSVAPTLDQTVTGTLTIVDSGSSTTTGQSGASIVTGTATAGSTVAVAVNGRGTITVQLAGTWVGTLSLEASTDNGTTWEPYGAHVKGAAAQIATPTGNGVFLANVSGVTNYRVRWTARTSGSVSVTFVGSVETGVVYVANTPGLLGVDNVTKATIKAASAFPLSTDTALVVATAALSPLATQAAASNSVLKASAGALKTLTVVAGATSGWVMVFDLTALPSNGATGASLKWCYPVLSNGTVGGIDKDWGEAPLIFTTGITVGFSSTACNSLTASATAFFYGQVQ